MDKKIKKYNRRKLKRVKTSTALVISGLALTPLQINKIGLPTPPEFIKTRTIRGQGKANYVEGGYVVARLNEIFGIANWNFQVIRETIQEKSIGVYGELSVIDHKKGYKITKGQYGSKERYDKIPIGDTLKAATTDCLKKCASFGFGIALDVYWGQFDDLEKSRIKVGVEKKLTREDVLKMTLERIKTESNPAILTQMRDKILNDEKIFTQEQRFDLAQKINDKLGISK